MRMDSYLIIFALWFSSVSYGLLLNNSVLRRKWSWNQKLFNSRNVALSRRLLPSDPESYYTVVSYYVIEDYKT